MKPNFGSASRGDGIVHCGYCNGPVDPGTNTCMSCEKKLCPSCHMPIVSNEMFCTACGTPLEQPKPKKPQKQCPNCGIWLDEDYQFCTNCSHSFSNLLERCPKCGLFLDSNGRCSNCGYQKPSDSLQRCPGCGAMVDDDICPSCGLIRVCPTCKETYVGDRCKRCSNKGGKVDPIDSKVSHDNLKPASNEMRDITFRSRE